MNINAHYMRALKQYAESGADKPPSKLVATADVVRDFEMAKISLDGVHAIYTQSERPVLVIQ